MELTVLSYNVQHFSLYHGNGIDYDIFAETIRSLNADICGLNEVRGAGLSEGYDPQAGIMGKKLNYHAYFAKAQNMSEGTDPYGNALLSRYPILSEETVIIPYPADANSPYPEDRSILKVTVAPDGKPLTFLSTHLGVTAREQEVGIRLLLPLLGNERTVLMGDFNLTPDSPLLSPVLEKMRDSAVLFSKPLLSWPSDIPEMKIDYLFTTPDIQVLSADIPDVETSDHRPYLARIQI